MKSPAWIKKDYDLQSELIEAWNWVKKLPDYHKDYDAYRKNAPKLEKLKPKTVLSSSPLVNVQAALKLKWGFWPLESPSSKTVLPIQFSANVGSLLAWHPFRRGVTVKDRHFQFAVNAHRYKKTATWAKYANKCKLPVLPKNIDFQIDPQKPITSVLSEVREFLEAVQEVYAIKPARPRAGGVFIAYRHHVMAILEKKPSEIMKELFPQPDDGKADEKDPRPSWRKRIYRLKAKRK